MELKSKNMRISKNPCVLLRTEVRSLSGFLDVQDSPRTSVRGSSRILASEKEGAVSANLFSNSARFILKKLNGAELNKKEIYSIINDIVKNSLSEPEIAYFVSAVYKNGMSLEETINLTEAIASTGRILKWKDKLIADKHSIGGIPGNRTTPIVVSICAAAGIKMPKTSSRAITSAAGTADVIETLADVSLSPERLKKVVEKTNACLSWGGSLGMAPADDKLIRVERLLNLDPEPQLIASILAKKIAAGSRNILIDIPYGENAKVSFKGAENLKKKFIKVGNHFKLKLKVVLTDGSQPIGNGVGPVLEMQDVLKVLKQEAPPKDLESKSIFLASQILEMTGKAKKGEGRKKARYLLNSGLAFKKFNEIVVAQGRTNNALKTARFKYEVKSKSKGIVTSLNNKSINYLARILGCPTAPSAGVYLNKHKKDKVNNKETLLVLYSESKKKLYEGIKFFNEEKPITIKE